MTQAEFKNAKFGAGMKVAYNGSDEPQDIVAVDFDQDLIGIDGDCDICERCENTIEIIQWLRCENCTVYDAGENLVGAEFELMKPQS